MRVRANEQLGARESSIGGADHPRASCTHPMREVGGPRSHLGDARWTFDSSEGHRDRDAVGTRLYALDVVARHDRRDEALREERAPRDERFDDSARQWRIDRDGDPGGIELD